MNTPRPANPAPDLPHGTPIPPATSAPETVHLAAAHRTANDPESGTGLRLVIAAVLFIGILAGLFVYGMASRHKDEKNLAAANEQEVDAPPAVDVMQVHRAAADQLLSLPGNARAFNETTIYARTSGYLKSWDHDIGDHVKSGELLATIETPELDDQLAAADAKVTEQKSEVDLAQASVNFAKLSYNRWQSAVPEGVVSTQDRDEKRAELDTSNAKLESAKAQLKLADTDVQRLQTLVGFKDVVAPFDGIITRRDVDIGDLVTAGSTSSTTPLFSIANSATIRVFVDVPQSASAQIKVGMSAKVSVSDSFGPAFMGKVDRTADAIDPASRTLRTEVLVPNPDNALKPGMYVQTTFLTTRASPPLEMPASALTLRPSGPAAAVVSSDGTVEFKNIHILRDLGDSIEVDTGLKDGEQVALNIGDDVTDGEKLDVHLVDDTTAPLPVKPLPQADAAAGTPEYAAKTPHRAVGGNAQ